MHGVGHFRTLQLHTPPDRLCPSFCHTSVCDVLSIPCDTLPLVLLPWLFLTGTLGPTKLGNPLLQEAKSNHSYLDARLPYSCEPRGAGSHIHFLKMPRAQHSSGTFFLYVRQKKRIRTRGRDSLAQLVL